VYSWNDETYNEIEWEIETVTSCPSEVKRVVKGMHPYVLPEFIIINLVADKEIKAWCDGWCKYEEDVSGGCSYE
jgi:uncharacterized protein involved in tolerance to divalent cations